MNLRLAAFLFFALAGSLQASLPDYGPLPDFALLEKSGAPLTRADLAGKPWVVNFIFTRCKGPCPMMTKRMAGLQSRLSPKAGLLSISVDPKHDTPPVLAAYARENGADPSRWLFATGDAKEVGSLIRDGFKIAAGPNPEAADPGDAFFHSLKFVLLDENARIRGYFDGDDPRDLARIRGALRDLKLEKQAPWVRRMPVLNAFLNSLSAICLMAGFFFIRKKAIPQHKAFMVSAFLFSTLFLVGYLVYHSQAGSVKFDGAGWVRTVYFAILITHSILAAAIVPLALVTLYRAWKGDFTRHAAVARLALPVWLYVSVTGVTVYWMLYRM